MFVACQKWRENSLSRSDWLTQKKENCRNTIKSKLKMSKVQCWFAFNIIWMTVVLISDPNRFNDVVHLARFCFYLIHTALHSKHSNWNEWMNNWLPGYGSVSMLQLIWAHTIYCTFGPPIICKWYSIWSTIWS